MQPDNQQQNGNWVYTPDNQNLDDQNYAPQPVDVYTPQSPSSSNAVTWTASQFIAHHKDGGWYAMMAGGFLMANIVIYLLTRDIISVVTISVVFILFLILSGSKPQQLSYSVDNQGIGIGNKFYPYNLFKSFAVIREGAIGSITLMPLKRMMPELSVYYAPEDEDRIVTVLMSSLPNEQRAEKATDRLMRRLRF